MNRADHKRLMELRQKTLTPREKRRADEFADALHPEGRKSVWPMRNGSALALQSWGRALGKEVMKESALLNFLNGKQWP